MKILKGSIIVLVSLILFASCTQTQRIDSNLEPYNIELRYGIKYYKKTAFTGEIFQNFENGQLESKENYKDGIRNGVFEYYFENGQLKSKENYKDGIRNGVFESYYENGQLESKEKYK
jgi:antitoxin component YwqK of YwqJK toxin-antitoxin module